jgi:hypothetical protein
VRPAPAPAPLPLELAGSPPAPLPLEPGASPPDRSPHRRLEEGGVQAPTYHTAASDIHHELAVPAFLGLFAGAVAAIVRRRSRAGT